MAFPDVGFAVDPLVGAMIGGLFGAIVGSFLATVAIRWPQRRSAARGRSACDGCGRTLHAIELVPLIGWLAVRGRCRTCGAPIDCLHPLVEMLAALIGGLCVWLSPDTGGALLALFGWCLLLAAVLDARHFWLPHRLSAAIGVAGLLCGESAMAAIGIDVPLIDRAVGALAGFLALWLLALGYRAVRARDGLGGGDAPFLAAIGAWTGWALLPSLLLFAAVAGLTVAVVRSTLAGGRHAAIGGQMLPFGTLLAVAVPFALVAGAMLFAPI